MASIDRKWIEGLPKAELHVHIEGSFSETMVRSLAQKHSVPLRNVNGSLFGFSNLAEFLEMLDYNCSLVHSREEACQIAYDFSFFQKKSGIRYSEVIVDPMHWKNLSLADLIMGMAEGFDKAAEDGGSECNLLVSLRRDESYDSMMNTVSWMAANHHDRIIGLSIDGDESAEGSDCSRFAEAFSIAGASGYHLVAHAGESSGASGVRDALDVLKVERIDHGVRAVEDECLIERLVRSNIPLDVCISSNLYGLYTKKTHPFNELYKRGVKVNLSTDDPVLMGITITDEYELVCELYGYTERDLKRLAINSFEASFLDEEMKTAYVEQIDKYHG